MQISCYSEEDRPSTVADLLYRLKHAIIHIKLEGISRYTSVLYLNSSNQTYYSYSIEQEKMPTYKLPFPFAFSAESRNL